MPSAGVAWLGDGESSSKMDGKLMPALSWKLSWGYEELNSSQRYLSISVLGHAHSMVAGFQEWATQERKTEKSTEFLWCSLRNSHGTTSNILYWSRQFIRVISFLRERTQTSPCYEWRVKVTVKKEKAEWEILPWPSLENTISPIISCLLVQEIKLSFSMASLNTVAQSST